MKKLKSKSDFILSSYSLLVSIELTTHFSDNVAILVQIRNILIERINSKIIVIIKTNSLMGYMTLVRKNWSISGNKVLHYRKLKLNYINWLYFFKPHKKS